jgi:hypothetical protein
MGRVFMWVIALASFVFMKRNKSSFCESNPCATAFWRQCCVFTGKNLLLMHGNVAPGRSGAPNWVWEWGECAPAWRKAVGQTA